MNSLQRRVVSPTSDRRHPVIRLGPRLALGEGHGR